MDLAAVLCYRSKQIRVNQMIARLWSRHEHDFIGTKFILNKEKFGLY